MCVCACVYVCVQARVLVYVVGPKRNETSLNAAEHGGVGEGQRQCLFPRTSNVSSETDVFLQQLTRPHGLFS